MRRRKAPRLRWPRRREAWLRRKQVHGILPTWQVLRTATMWRECNGPPFQVPPRKYWRNVAATLRFVRRHVVPAVGPVQAVSGYRNEDLNACSGGAEQSAHRHFFALDLVPVKEVPRPQMMRSLCAIHDFRGDDYDIGLGFYSGHRFHVDSKGFRRWGSNGRSATSPCNTHIFS